MTSLAQKSFAQRKELRELTIEFSRRFPQWTDRFAGAGSPQELTEIANRLFQELVEDIHSEEGLQKDLPARLHRFIADNLHLGPGLKNLAEFLGYSEKYCSDFFQARMGQPFSTYLKQLRLEKAEQLLKESPATLAQIAERLGFHDQFAFSHFFKKATGSSPKLFRARHGKPPLPPNW